MSHAATAPLLGQPRDLARSAAIRFFNLYDDDDDNSSTNFTGDSDSDQKPAPKPPKQKKEKDPNKPNPIAAFFKNKRNLYITIGAAAVLLIALIVIIVVAMQPKTFYLDDYFTVNMEGTDGYGTATVEWDRDALREVNEYLGKKSSKKMSNELGQYGDLLGQLGDALGDLYESSFSLTSYVSVTLDPSTDLKNGDKVTVTMNIPADFEDTYGVRFKLHHEEIEVSGLGAVSAYDPLEKVSVEFAGYTGYGDYAFKLPEESVTTSFGTAYYYTNYSGNLQVSLENKSGRSYTLTYTVSVPDDLKNGDLITVTLSEDSSSSAETLASMFGITVSDKSATFTVSGLSELTTVSPSDFVSLTCEGYSGYGTASLSVTQTSVKQGNHTLQLSTKEGWGNRYYLEIEIIDGNGGDNYSFTYESNFGKALKNDDVLTFSTDEYRIDRIRAHYGLVFPTEFTCTVSGLEVGTTADPFTAVSMTYTGYDGFGTAESALTAETVAAGDFVLKPTLTDNDLVIVVADATGENIFTVTYRLNKYRNLANGDEISFVYRSSFGIANLREALELYKLNFPEEKTFTVSSLAAVTQTDVRDQLSFTFEGENGSIEMTVGLKQDSITVGDYTIHLEVKQESGWFSKYWVETFTIIDAEGNMVASGRYTTSRMNNLSEGDTVTISEDMNESQIASLTGLLFSTENKQVIVSTK